jgi:hypothetical protein
MTIISAVGRKRQENQEFKVRSYLKNKKNQIEFNENKIYSLCLKNKFPDCICSEVTFFSKLY